MKHFEEQVSQAAARLRNEENSRLRVPRNPPSVRRHFLGMGATPVAAVAGLLWGVELGRMSGESSLQQVSQVIDTVIRREVVRDTVYSVRPESKVASWQAGRKANGAEETAPVRRIQAESRKQGQETRLYRRGRGNVFWKTASTIPCSGRL
mgnify:CR=1 FL=1